MIQTRNLCKTYKNGFRAVKNLNLSVERGDIFGYLGPNGAGKTTTIRMLDGLLEPTDGQAFIAGMDITKKPTEIRRVIGVVPESHGYYYSMTAREYLEYFASLFVPGQREDRYIQSLLQKVGLEEKQDIAVGKFSRGMKQRLGIAKALVNRPQIIFLDEPTLGLDPRGQYEIQQLLLEINKSEHITIFITSHQLKDIEVMCNKVCIVKNGVLEAQGSIKELQTQYMQHITVLIQTNDNYAARNIIENHGQVRRVTELEDGTLEVKFRKGLAPSEAEQLKHQMMAEILQHDISIEKFSRKNLTMEEIFFRATEQQEGMRA